MILTECSFWYDWVHLIILSHFCLNLTTTVVSGYSSVIQIHSTGRIWVGFTRPHTAAYTHTLRFEWQRTQVERVELIFCEQYSKTFPASLSLSVEYIYIYRSSSSNGTLWSPAVRTCHMLLSPTRSLFKTLPDLMAPVSEPVVLMYF